MSKKLMAGSPADRLYGLDPLIAAAKDLSILDVGCHKGYVSYAFACAGARSIDAFDRFEDGVATTRSLLEDFEIPLRVEPADFTNGLPAGLAERYDVVLYLGMHQHLARQMAESLLHGLVETLVKMTGQYLAARTNPKHLDDISRIAERHGLTLIHHSAFNPNVGPVRIFRRSAT